VIGFTGSKGADGNFGGATFDYTFDTVTTNTDPGQGKLKFNNANISLATQMYIDDTNDAGTDIQTFLRTIDDSTSTIKGHFRISNRLDANDFAIFTISSIVEETGYFTVNSSYVSGSATSFSSNEDIIITFARTGDRGDTGFTGSQGDIGFTGSQGDVGFTGSQGDTGFVGSQGDIGFTGSQGDTGFVGSQGDIGFTGSQGDIGFTGSQGDTGFVGSRGIPGVSGDGGGVFVVYGEKNADISSGQFFSFGNGSNNSSAGISIYEDCVLDGLSVRAASFFTSETEIEIYINGEASGNKIIIGNGVASGYISGFEQPIFSGDIISLRVNSGSGGTVVTAGAWFLTNGAKGYTGSQGDTGFVGSKGELGIAGFLADVSNTAPNTTTEGHMWFDTNDASLSVYFDDGNSEQWVVVSGERGINWICWQSRCYWIYWFKRIYWFFWFYW